MEDKDAEIYPCCECGKLRSENQGGKIFTVCDECWEDHYGSQAMMLPTKPTEKE